MDITIHKQIKKKIKLSVIRAIIKFYKSGNVNNLPGLGHMSMLPLCTMRHSEGGKEDPQDLTV